MNTRLLLAMATLAVFVLARPAAAQEEVEADTIYVSGDNSIVIISDDGRRIIVRSAGDLDWPKIFVGDETISYPRVFNVRPGQWRMPKMEVRTYPFGDDDEKDFAFFGEHFGNMGNFSVNFGDDFALYRGESMKERTELMKMEMESQRLARRARRADGDERAQLEQELEEKLNEVFDRKQALREERVEKLREALNKALDQQNDRDQSRNEIIERRLRELLGQSGKYDW